MSKAVNEQTAGDRILLETLTVGFAQKVSIALVSVQPLWTLCLCG